MKMFYGREDILQRFASLWRKPTSSFVVCRGRRRIGKSTLVKEFARRSHARLLLFEGLAPNAEDPITNQDQLDEFMRRLARQTGRRKVRVDDWGDAFEELDGAIDDREKTVVLLDEISWMGEADRRFPSKLKNAWDDFFHEHPRLILFVCGSVSAWIKRNILGSKGFAGRTSLDVVVPELPVADCVRFWRGKADRVPSREMLDVLSVTGGVPRYLEEIDPSLSADENLRLMCFSPEGYLFRDFIEIFGDIYGEKAEVKGAVLNQLAAGALTLSEIAAGLGKERNGHLSEILEELETSGFVANDGGKNPQTGKASRTGRYRLRDNYTRFFLKYIVPHSDEIRSGAYRFAKLELLPGWSTIMGLQFENLVYANLPRILDRLGENRRPFLSAAPYRCRRSTRKGGCQVDLLLQTEKAAYVIEIKRRGEIGEEVIDEVEKKLKALPVPRGKAKRAVLVYDGRLDPRIENSDFFDFIIDFQTLMR